MDMTASMIGHNTLVEQVGCAHAFMYACVGGHACVRACMRVWIYMCVCVHVRLNVHVYACLCVPVNREHGDH